MTIYLDVIWLLNFCTDYLLLSLTAILLKRRVQKKRLIIGSLIASLYVVVVFLPYASFFYHPLFKLIFSMVIVMVSFGFKRFSYFFQNVAMFYLVTFMIGGGLLAIHYMLHTKSKLLNDIAVMKASGFGDPISWSFVVIGFPLLWYFSRQRIEYIDLRKMTYDQISNVELRIEDQVFHLKGFIDSGNHLYDPISRSPVMILDSTRVNLPAAITERIEQPFLPYEGEDHSWSKRLRVIPYRSVGQGQRFLLAVRPDEIRVFQEKKQYDVKQAFVGLSKQPLSKDGDFDCILHPKMLLQAKEVHPFKNNEKQEDRKDEKVEASTHSTLV